MLCEMSELLNREKKHLIALCEHALQYKGSPVPVHAQKHHWTPWLEEQTPTLSKIKSQHGFFQKFSLLIYWLGVQSLWMMTTQVWGLDCWLVVLKASLWMCNKNRKPCSTIQILITRVVGEAFKTSARPSDSLKYLPFFCVGVDQIKPEIWQCTHM